MVKPNSKKISKDVVQENFDSKDFGRQRESVVGERSFVETKFPVRIAKIGIKSVGNHSESDGNFRSFLNQRYRMLFPDLVVEDIYLVPEFGLDYVTEMNENNANESALWLVLKSNFSNGYWEIKHRNFAAAKRLINQFFILPKKSLFDDKECDDNEDDRDDDIDFYDGRNCRTFASTVEHLYKRLEAAHAVDDCLDRYQDDTIQHKNLLVKLKPYQVKTIKWMLSREQLKHHTCGFVEIMKCGIGPLDDPTKFFYNPKLTMLTTDPSICQCVALPRGGILAEEMGMGKTIEILNLILLNPRPPVNQMNRSPSVEADEPPTKKKKRTTNSVQCLCAQTRNKDTISCTKCLTLQHRSCVDQMNSDITPDSEYICPGCWQNEVPIPAKTTFIVSPQAIKTQWKTETDNRIQKGKISMLLYVGTKSCKWVNPAKLASYDIILTDYETLRGEFNYSGRNTSDRVLRNESSMIKRKSPLLNLNFWRLCLDESQMVINMQSKHAQMISALSAVNRWAVTGTPIETALNDLFGLISFINYSPYNQRTRLSEIVNHLDCRSNFEPLVSILQPIMRRTCKSESIMNEMSVPKQVEQVHYVHISGLNRYHYNQERDNCRQMFNQLISSQHLDTPLSNLNPQSLERIMEPVRTLRRACTILHYLDKDGNTIVMRPEQMLQHLIKTNEVDAKAELANIASKLKSILALSLGQHKHKAIASKNSLESCQSILAWTTNYKAEPTMIESLLPTQVMQNILFNNGCDSSKYNAELKYNETQFCNTQFDAIVGFQVERQNAAEKFDDFERWFVQNCFDWANAALTGRSQGQVLNQIKSRIDSSFDNVGTVVGSISTVSKALLYWSSNLHRQRKTFQQSFKQLDAMIVQVKSKYPKERWSSEFFAVLLNEAINCHLNKTVKDDSSNVEPAPPKGSKKDCTLCSLNEQLGSYGFFITDTAHKMTTRTGRDSTNPSFQESILKVILQSNEYLGNINTKFGIKLLAGLEKLRHEFQKYKAMLTSITKNIAFFYKVQQRKPPKPTVTLSLLTLQLWLEDVGNSKTVYERKVRVNRYLNSMKENSEIEECAICMSFVVTYSVFECGHQCCNDCFKKLDQDRLHRFECPFCRQIQFVKNTHNFTVDESENYTDSSKKIELIVRKVIELKEADRNVKILIFSQWTDVLHTLKDELLTNEIPSRSIVSAGKSLQRMVDEFKDPRSNITCLLMPYKFGSKGLNLIEATNVFLVEPIINRGDELQTLGRVHRIGQTRETCVHRFITKNTIEETIFKVMSTDAAGLMSSEKCTIKTLVDLFGDTD